LSDALVSDALVSDALVSDALVSALDLDLWDLDALHLSFEPSLCSVLHGDIEYGHEQISWYMCLSSLAVSVIHHHGNPAGPHEGTA
ncbi:hypothetical protein KUCAC02_037257, partial [Chaenocephalus aceratus]